MEDCLEVCSDESPLSKALIKVTTAINAIRSNINLRMIPPNKNKEKPLSHTISSLLF